MDLNFVFEGRVGMAGDDFALENGELEGPGECGWYCTKLSRSLL